MDVDKAKEPQKSWAEILQDIASHIAEIIRSELRLLKFELRDTTARAAIPAATLVAGLAFGIYALGFLLLTIAFALWIVLPGWLATLIVCIGCSLLAAILTASAVKAFKRINVIPEMTAANVKEDVEWLKQQVR